MTKIITDELIENYHRAVINFNETIKKERKHRQTLCENFISEWAEVVEEIGRRNRKENNEKI
jgi:protoheme ferro-lyase